MVGRNSVCIHIRYWNRKIEFERCSRCKEVSDTTSGVGSSSAPCPCSACRACAMSMSAVPWQDSRSQPRLPKPHHTLGENICDSTLLKNSAEMTFKWHWNHHPIFGIWTLRSPAARRAELVASLAQMWRRVLGLGPRSQNVCWSLLCFIMKKYKRLVQYGTLYTIRMIVA